MKSGGYSHMLSGHTGQVTAITWSPRNEFILASGSSDNSIIIWDIRKSNAALSRKSYPNTEMRNAPQSQNSQAQPKSSNILAPDLSIMGLAFAPSGLHLAAVNMNATFSVWDINDNLIDVCLGTYSIGNKTNFQRIESKSLIPSITDCRVGSELLVIPAVCGPGNFGVGVYDLHRGHQINVLQAHFGRNSCVALRQQNGDLFSGGFDGEILHWSPKYMKFSEDADDNPANDKVNFDSWSD
ncbi:DNA excision repair protein ERCC-8 [Physocladia obscura]|uniref:DNA excision repair protein ERCC-8 n=1 Tax=Physocladia obscura TaxID=109957 RepID=A0AAD5XM88_9FUNG|nr:DNA excision repair protein ERCC-8 [Physocladia obscura]